MWKQSRILCQKVFVLTSKSPFSKDYALKDQINRSSGSCMDNIAEGFARGGNREFIHFLSISRGSNAEVRSQLHRASDRQYITNEQATELVELNNSIGAKITKMMNYLNSSDRKGMKFNK